MTVIANQVTNLLFTNIQSVDELSQAQLEAFIEQYPYFAPLHFLMAAKQNDTQAKHTSVYNKALLHFPNAIQLDYLLHGGGEAMFSVKHTVVTTEDIRSIIANAQETEKINAVTEHENITTVEEETVIAEKPVVIETTKEEKQVSIEETSVIETPEKLATVVNEVAETEDEIDQPTLDENGEEDGPEIIIPGLKIEAIDPKTAELNLTPVHMHTVDYFASLGIKFKEQDKPIAKFDRQLKSFTDWLKVIKKVPDSPGLKLGDTHAEKKVEEMAGLSLKNEKIITETMAEVWIKQGNKAKAIDVYEKLSLLDPTKSAYFATRIENLKKSN